MELKVWVEGIQRIVCGVTEKTTCQDVVYALAHATGRTGRFTLIERWRNNERLLAPMEHPLKVLTKWGDYSPDVQFILQRSPLDPSPKQQHSGQHRQQSSSGSGSGGGGTSQPTPGAANNSGASDLNSKGAIWKAPPTHGKPPPSYPPPPPASTNAANNAKTDAARLSPDSGQGSDPTGSDTSNWSDQEKARTATHMTTSRPSQLYPTGGWSRFTSPSPDRGLHHIPSSSSIDGGHPPHHYGYSTAATSSSANLGLAHSNMSQQLSHTSSSRIANGFPQQQQQQHMSQYYSQQVPPQYRNPPAGPNAPRQPSPLPPPYREPPPPPPSALAARASTTSPEPTRRRAQGYYNSHHGAAGTNSRSSKSPPTSNSRGYVSSAGIGAHYQSGESGRRPHSPSPRGDGYPPHGRPPHYSPPPHHRVDYRGVSSRGSSPRHSNGLSNSSAGGSGRSHSGAPGSSPARGDKSPAAGGSWAASGRQGYSYAGSGHSSSGNGDPYAKHQESNYKDLLSLVNAQQTRIQSQHAEIKHCDNELKQWSSLYSGGGPVDYLPSQLEAVLAEVRRLEDTANRNEDELTKFSTEGKENKEIRCELEQLKHRLEMTDLELQRTNATLRGLGDEMRTYSQEKSKQKEEELKGEMDRIQQEIRLLQKSSEDSATLSEKLNREVQNVEVEITIRKEEVERLIQDMKSANLESLTISPPEETKAFLDGAAKPVSTRKMMGSPRQLESAVPTSKNPHGVWV